MKKLSILLVGLLLSMSNTFATEWIVEYEDPVDSSDGTPYEGSLQHALMNFEPGDVIKFTPSMAGKTIFFKTAWEMKKGTITIDASELTSKVIFDASGKATPPINNMVCFFSSAANNSDPSTHFTVKNIVFQNLIVSPTTTAEVGCINSKYGNVTVESCDFIDNKLYGPSSSSGSSVQGAILCSVTKNNLYVKGCRFINNYGRKGACVTLWPMAMTIVENCYFNGNKSISGGACVYSLTSGVVKGSESTVIMRNNLLTKNIGNTHGSLVLSEAPVQGPYLQLYNNTMVGNINSSTGSAQLPFVATKYRRMHLAGNLFAGNYNSATPPALNNEIGFASSMSATLHEDSLVLEGYNIFSSPRNYGTPISQEKLDATHNFKYIDWKDNPLVQPLTNELMIPTTDATLYSEYIKVIPSASLTWLGVVPTDQRGVLRTDAFSCIGAYEESRQPTAIDSQVGLPTTRLWLSADVLHVSEAVSQITIFSITGQFVNRAENVSTLSLEGLPHGVYVAKLVAAKGKTSMLKFSY